MGAPVLSVDRVTLRRGCFVCGGPDLGEPSDGEPPICAPCARRLVQHLVTATAHAVDQIFGLERDAAPTTAADVAFEKFKREVANAALGARELFDIAVAFREMGLRGSTIVMAARAATVGDDVPTLSRALTFIFSPEWAGAETLARVEAAIRDR